MTKFEEELNKIEVEVQTPLDKYIVEKAASDESLYAQHYEAVLEKFKDWHSDEDYQRAKRMVEHVQVENEMLKAKLKSQLQQQVLPVVPECVARDIEKLKSFNKDGKNFHIFDLSYYSEESINWVEYDYDNYVKFYLAVATGKYEVEKPQLFKLIFPNSTAVLQKDGELNSFANTVYKRYLIENAMTEQEIKSIDERYMEFAVPVEDGE